MLMFRDRMLLMRVFGLFICCFSLNVFASGIQMSPLGVYFKATEQIQSVTVDNNYDIPKVFSTYIAKLDIKTGKYSKTDDILVVPPLVTMPAHGHQVFRMVLVKPRNLEMETAYRFVISEVPPDMKMLHVKHGVAMVMHYDLPVMVLPANPVVKLQWNGHMLSDNKLNLHVNNQGNVYSVIRSISVYDKADVKKERPIFTSSSDQKEKKNDVSGVVYARQQLSWTVNLQKPITGKSLVVVANTSKGDVSADLVLS